MSPTSAPEQINNDYYVLLTSSSGFRTVMNVGSTSGMKMFLWQMNITLVNDYTLNTCNNMTLHHRCPSPQLQNHFNSWLMCDFHHRFQMKHPHSLLSCITQQYNFSSYYSCRELCNILENKNHNHRMIKTKAHELTCHWETTAYINTSFSRAKLWRCATRNVSWCDLIFLGIRSVHCLTSHLHGCCDTLVGVTFFFFETGEGWNVPCCPRCSALITNLIQPHS